MITQSLHNIYTIFAQSWHYPNHSRSMSKHMEDPLILYYVIYGQPLIGAGAMVNVKAGTWMYQIMVLKWNISILVLNPNPNHSGCHGQWSSHCEMSNAGKLIRPGDIPRTQPFTQAISSASIFFGYSIFLDIPGYS